MADAARDESAAVVRPAAGPFLSRARRRLAAAGIETAALDARILCAEALGLSAAALVADPDRPVDPCAEARLEGLISLRERGEPVGRILGRRGFWSLDLALSPATLEPRPETETLVAAVLGHLDGKGLRTAPVRIADLGTGSGAILLALLSECPRAVGIGIDVSPGALETARANAERAGLADRVVFARGDFGASLSPDVDIVVSNPPYVTTAELASLPAEVAAYDPVLALHGGPDGLAAYRAILAGLAAAWRNEAAFRADRQLFVELSPQLVDSLSCEAERRGWTIGKWYPDLGGGIRVARLNLPK